jgi:lipopolysaccharide heptosyltransferase I
MRILIVKLGSIGDVVHTLPALAALRRAQPGAYIAWAVERGAAARLLEGNSCLDDLIVFDLRGWRKRLWRPATWRAVYATVGQMHQAEFDVALDFQGLLKSGGLAQFSRATRRIGFATEALREPASASLLTEQVEVDDREHVIRKNLRLAEYLGCPVGEAYQFPVALSAADESFAARQAARFNAGFAMLNPGGGWPTKLWSPGGYAALADRLWRHYDLRSIVTYGPGEEALAREIVEQSQLNAATPVDATLKQFFALAQRARLFVGGDTGPMHLAAAAGAPVVALFGPTSARRNGPFAAGDVVVERFDLDCRADCYRRSCSHISCMKLPLETVWEGVVRRMRNAEGGRQIVSRDLPVILAR